LAANAANVAAQPLRTPAMRGYELHEFFNFATQQPSLNRQQMLPFYAFVGKLCTFLKGVAAWLH
jgi:hypothetical protein